MNGRHLAHISNPLEIVHLPARHAETVQQVVDHVLSGRIGSIVLLVYDAEGKQSVHSVAVANHKTHMEHLIAEGMTAIDLVVGGVDIRLYPQA